MNTPLDNSDMDIFTDGSSFVWDGKWKAGYAVVTSEQLLEVKSLPAPPRYKCPIARICCFDPSPRVKQRAASKYLH